MDTSCAQLTENNWMQWLHGENFQLTWMLLLLHGVSQMEVKNEFNQAYVRLIDIYCSLNPISIGFHLAHKIIVAGSHFSMPLSFGLVSGPNKLIKFIILKQGVQMWFMSMLCTHGFNTFMQ